MDVKSFLAELLSALTILDFVNDVNLKAEGLILSGRVMLQKSMFLEVYYNEMTETIAFALIEEQRRIWGIDKDNIRDWHIHPLDDPTKHTSIKPLSVFELIETLSKVWKEVSK